MYDVLWLSQMIQYLEALTVNIVASFKDLEKLSFNEVHAFRVLSKNPNYIFIITFQGIFKYQKNSPDQRILRRISLKSLEGEADISFVVSVVDIESRSFR